MLHRNTTDKTTLRDMLATIQRRYGRAERIWVMDRDIRTEEVLAELHAADPQVRYLIGTPKGRLTKLEAALSARHWSEDRSQLRSEAAPARRRTVRARQERYAHRARSAACAGGW